ncbi:hypothetical protein [Ktedonobacter robiniae]|uniref:SurA N-terminal domain-containing protein n=1 Tax=Ktedonobacter robiniae TaxID=2778365 RepID=A0ABQ3UYQ6_9CHLR|nr:hypothetical protein [Ktedonobacter robiniae]GHO57841.1 hypothetical protein KSB_63160 [Ktedonobacter robiniae]
MLNKDEHHTSLLQHKPLRQQKLRLAPFLLLLGGMVILSALLLLGWQVYTTNNASSSTNSNTGQRSAQDDSPTQNPWDEYPDVYWQTLRAQVAQRLHMSEQQIQDNLHATLLANVTADGKKNGISSANAAKWMNDLASAHGISQTQLHTIKITAIREAHKVLVNRHILTQQQADENMRMMNQDDLNFHMVEAFSGGDDSNGQKK